MKVNKERLVKTFIKLVKIDSESGKEKKIIDYLKKELKLLSFKSFIDKGGNLIARNSENPILFLSAHVDTVKPGKGIKPIITKSGVIKTDGSTILGADDKSGVVGILEVLKILKENNYKSDLELVFTVKEELGLAGSSKIEKKNILSKKGINLDSAPGSIVSGEPAIIQLDIEIKGKSSHSGTPEEGINSIEVAADAISKIKQGKINKDTTVNFGTISGGDGRNIVAERVFILAETRSLDRNKLTISTEKIINQFKKSAKEKGATVKITKNKQGEPYKIDKNDKLLKTLTSVCKKNKTTVEMAISMGVTDTNSFQSKGISCFTTGIGFSNIHTTREFVKISEMVRGTKIILETILEFSEKKI